MNLPSLILLSLLFPPFLLALLPAQYLANLIRMRRFLRYSISTHLTRHILVWCMVSMGGLPLPLGAQQVFSSTGDPYMLDAWTVNSGLPQNSVTSLVQSAEGYLWFGTNGGLVRFDGVRFETYERLGGGDPRTQRITSLVEGLDSSLWIGTESGEIHSYRRGVFTKLTGMADGRGLPVNCMARDSSGLVWIGTHDRGLLRVLRLDGGRDSVVASTLQPQLSRSPITALVTDTDGNLWVGGIGGLARLAGAGIRTFALPGISPDFMVTSIACNDLGSVVVGTSDMTIFALKGDEFIKIPQASIPRPVSFDLLSDSRGLIILVASKVGLMRLRGGLLYLPGSSEWESGSHVRQLLVDREQNFWIGTSTDGLLRLRRATFSMIEWGGSRTNVTSMAHDPKRGVWVSISCGGVLLVSGNQTQPHPISEITKNWCVWSVMRDRTGHLWVGTWGNGLFRFDPEDPPKSMRQYSKANGFPSNVVLSLSEGSGGVVWAGTYDAGLVRITGSGVRSWTMLEGLPSADIRSAVEDSRHRVWIGTSMGVAMMDSAGITSFSDDPLAIQAPVRTILPEPDGTVWFGTYGGGLLRHRKGTFAQLTTSKGLFDNIVSQLLLDDDGYLWMGSNRGISKASKQELNACADGRLPHVTVLTYSQSDGLSTVETNGGFSPAGLILPEGDIWFPTSRGIAHAHASRLEPNRTPPPVIIERVVLDGKDIAWTPFTTIPPNVEEVRIHFTALSLTSPSKVRFRYQLVGYNKGWTELSGARVATYTNVTPGQFRFRVIAANNDGVWNEEGAEVTLSFESPYWQTLWFRGLAVLALVGMGMLVVAIRLRHVRLEKTRQEETSRRLIRGQEEERQRIAGELHDSLGQELIVAKNRLLLAAHHIGEDTPAKKEMMQVVDTLSTSLRSVRSIAYNLRPFQLDRLGLTETIRSTVRAVQQATSIQIETEIGMVDRLLSREAEIGIFRIVQEGMTNVVKHSGASRASIVVAYDEGWVVIRIQDDGKGFDPLDAADKASYGFGLSSIEERARMLRGHSKVTSTLGSGATLAVRIPLAGNEPEETA